MKQHTILHTIETGGPGGAETVLLDLASGLDTARFRSIALVSREGWLSARLAERSVRTLIARSQPRHLAGLAGILMRVIRQEDIDLVHSHLPDQNFYSCVAGSLTGRPSVVTYHGALPRGGFPAAVKMFWVRQAATAVVAVSDCLARSLGESGFPEKKLVRIHNGIDLDRFAPGGTGKLRAELACANGTKLIGTVANLRKSKGYEFFLRAAHKVADALPEARFVAIGDAKPEFREPLQHLLHQLSLDDRFCFLGFRDDVPEILGDLDVFVLPSVSEGFSLATVEAMAANRPVVATRSGGPEELVENGRTGLLVPPSDPEALAAGICELLRDPQRAALLSCNARAEVENRFSVATMIRRYETVYERCLGEGNP